MTVSNSNINNIIETVFTKLNEKYSFESEEYLKELKKLLSECLKDTLNISEILSDEVDKNCSVSCSCKCTCTCSRRCTCALGDGCIYIKPNCNNSQCADVEIDALEDIYIQPPEHKHLKNQCKMYVSAYASAPAPAPAHAHAPKQMEPHQLTYLPTEMHRDSQEHEKIQYTLHEDIKLIKDNYIEPPKKENKKQGRCKNKAHKKTAYIRFLQEEYATVKNNKKEKLTFEESQKALKEISIKWQANKQKSTRKLSEYNIFYKNNVKDLMKTKPAGISIMKHISMAWNAGKEHKEK
jgi:hypothetical protein